MTEQIHMWERLETDKDKSYQAFCIYRDLGRERSLEKAWKQYKNSKKTVGKIQGYFLKWSSEHNWVERANAYDVYLDQMQREALEQRVNEAKTQLVDGMMTRLESLFGDWDDAHKMAKMLKHKDTIETPDGKSMKVMELNLGGYHKLTRWLSDIDSLFRRQLSMPDRFTQSSVERKGTLDINNRDVTDYSDAELDAIIADEESE